MLLLDGVVFGYLRKGNTTSLYGGACIGFLLIRRIHILQFAPPHYQSIANQLKTGFTLFSLLPHLLHLSSLFTRSLFSLIWRSSSILCNKSGKSKPLNTTHWKTQTIPLSLLP